MKKYNDAVKAKNDALTAEEPSEEKPKPLPAKPMPPAAPGVWSGLYTNVDITFDPASSTYITGDKQLIARRKNINTDDPNSEWADTRRFGYIYTHSDTNDVTFTAGYSGHVFGRFGLFENITQAPARAVTLIDDTILNNDKIHNYL